MLNIFVFIKIVNSNHNSRVVFIRWDAKHPAFDPNIYEEALDPELCSKQIEHLIWNDTHLMMTCKY